LVKVNLLPPEISKSKEIAFPALNIQRAPVFLFSLVIVFFLISISLRLMTMYQKKGLYDVTRQYQQAEELAKKNRILKQEQDKLIKECNLLEGYLKRNVVWSEKLSQLRNLIPKEVWLMYLSFEKKGIEDSALYSLYLRGGLISQDKTSPLGILSKFINQLKEDKAFFRDFDNPILTDLRTETRQNLEIMTFAVEIPFRKM